MSIFDFFNWTQIGQKTPIEKRDGHGNTVFDYPDQWRTVHRADFQYGTSTEDEQARAMIGDTATLYLPGETNPDPHSIWRYPNKADGDVWEQEGNTEHHEDPTGLLTYTLIHLKRREG